MSFLSKIKKKAKELFWSDEPTKYGLGSEKGLLGGATAKEVVKATAGGAVVIGATTLASAVAVEALASSVAGGLPKVAEKVKSAVAKRGVVGTAKAVVKTAAVGGVIAGGGIALLPEVYKGTKKATEIAVGVVKGDLPLEGNIGDIGKTAGALAGGALVGGLIGAGIDKLLEKDVSPPSLPITPTSPFSPSAPLTPETQVLGKEVSSTTKKRRKARKAGKSQGNSQNLRVNIVNQSRIQSAKIINSRRMKRIGWA